MKTKPRFYCPDCGTEYAIAFNYKKLGDSIHCDSCGAVNVIDRTLKGIDWSKKDMYEGIGRPDLKPKPKTKPKWEKRFDERIDDIWDDLPDCVKNELKSFIQQTIDQEVKEAVEGLRMEATKALRGTLESLSDRTFEHTMKGKNNPFEVTDDDWQQCGVEFDDIEKIFNHKFDDVELDKLLGKKEK